MPTRHTRLCACASTEAVWMPVWQRACLWRACGFVEEWERSAADRTLYSFLHLFSGAPAKMTLRTESLLLAPAHNGSSSQLRQVRGAGLPNVSAPVSSLVAVARASGLYLLVACDSDGSSTARSASASLVNSQLYRSPCAWRDASRRRAMHCRGACARSPSPCPVAAFVPFLLFPDGCLRAKCHPAMSHVSAEWREAATAKASRCSWCRSCRPGPRASGAPLLSRASLLPSACASWSSCLIAIAPCAALPVHQGWA